MTANGVAAWKDPDGDGVATATLNSAGGSVSAESDVPGLVADLALKAPLASPTFTGTVTLPNSTVTSAMIVDGTIVTGDLNAAAGITSGQLAGSIAASKISGTAITAADVGTVTSTMIARTNAISRTGALAETFPRNQPGGAIATFSPTLGALYLIAIELPINLVIGHITFLSGTAAANGPTHQWFGLYNSSRVQLATTTDDTTTAWAGSSEKTLAIATTAGGAAATFTTTYSGLHYLGICQAASTAGAQLITGASIATLNGLAPIVMGTSDTTQTTPPSFAHTATTITATGNIPYAYLSA